jgi:hypothetical protein
MITMAGEKMAGRVAASLLKATGLDELVCDNYSGTILLPLSLLPPGLLQVSCGAEMCSA